MTRLGTNAVEEEPVIHHQAWRHGAKDPFHHSGLVMDHDLRPVEHEREALRRHCDLGIRLIIGEDTGNDIDAISKIGHDDMYQPANDEQRAAGHLPADVRSALREVKNNSVMSVRLFKAPHQGGHHARQPLRIKQRERLRRSGQQVLKPAGLVFYLDMLKNSREILSRKPHRMVVIHCLVGHQFDDHLIFHRVHGRDIRRARDDAKDEGPGDQACYDKP